MPNILNADTLALQQVCLPVRAPRRMPDRRETATIAAARGTWLKPSDFRVNAAGELAVPTAKFLEGGSVGGGASPQAKLLAAGFVAVSAVEAVVRVGSPPAGPRPVRRHGRSRP